MSKKLLPFNVKNILDRDTVELNIMIIGCSNIGLTIAETLAREKHNVTIIDKNERKLQASIAGFDIMGFAGNGASYRLLLDAGIQNTDLFVAVTESDELNLLCCTIASQVSKCSTIARVRTPEYSDEVWYLRDKLKLTMVINPELESALEISRILNLPAALVVNPFARGEAEMVTFRVAPDSPLIGKHLTDLMSGMKTRMLFTAVHRDDVTYIPRGNYIFQAEDLVTYVSARRDGLNCLKALSLPTNQLKNCIVVGASRIAFYLVKQLEKAGIKVKIIDKDYAKCEAFSAALPSAMMINTDASDTHTLLEEGFWDSDALIFLTGSDELNMTLAHYSSNNSEAKVMTRLSNPQSNVVAEDLDLGSIIRPRIIASDLILAYARAKSISAEENIETLYSLFDDTIEAIEFYINEDLEFTGKPLMGLGIQSHSIVALIHREGKLIFPKGTDTIEKGDSVMVVTTNLGSRDIMDIFE